MEIAIQAAQLLLSLSILIVLHEFGHFLPARLFGTRVEKFYLFFDYKFSLFKFKKGETEYGIGWIPLGGYVKISGMIDESMDKEQMAKAPEPYEFRAKPAWQRLIIMTGGVTVNLILGFLIYSMILFVWGTERLPLANVENGMHYDSLMTSAGFKDGDKIVMVGDQVPYDSQEFTKLMFLGGHHSVTVERDGSKKVIDLPENFTEKLLENSKSGPLVIPRVPAVVGELIAGLPADSAGIKVGERIAAIDGQKVDFFLDANRIIEKSNHKALDLTILDSVGVERHVMVKTDQNDMLGFRHPAYNEVFKTVTTHYGFFAAIPAGIDFGITTLKDYVNQFKLVFTKAGIKQIGGFGSMGKLFHKEWDWESFWERTALISIILAFMNILPIPALDGGHVIFLLWEMIAGKPAPDKVMEYAQYAGMILLAGLMLFANGNDVFRSFFN